MNVGLIGCGNIGSRHLQSLLAAERPQRIWVAEPEAKALAAAKECAAGVDSVGKEVIYVADLAELPKKLDLAVIATPARERRSAFEALVAAHAVGAMILEKFLFPRLSDYAAVGKSLGETGIPAWVNCPRRVWKGYQEVRDTFCGRTDVTMRQAGSAWGLASNAVHLLDTYAYVTGSAPVAVKADRLDPASGDSKRPGYLEVFGTLDAVVPGSGGIELTCYRQGALPRLVEFVSAEARVLIDEGRGKAIWTTPNVKGEERSFDVLPVSAMGFVFDGILDQHACGLPTYAEASTQHQLVLHAINRHLHQDANEPLWIT